MRSLLAAALLLAATPAFASRVVTHNFSSVIAAPHVRTMTIDIPAGQISVVNGKAGEIRILGTVTRDYDRWDRRASMQRIVDDISAETFVNGEDAVVRRRFGPNAQSWRSQKFANFDLTIEVPAGTSVSFDTSFGEIDMHGSFGNIDIDLRAGELRLITPRADVRELNASCRVGEVHTNLGSEIVTREGVFPGTTHFDNPSGRTVVNAHVTAGEVHVELTK